MLRSSKKRKTAQKVSAQQIRALLYLHGSSLADVARREGVHRSTVTRVINGEWESERIKKRIAKILSRSIRELWAA